MLTPAIPPSGDAPADQVGLPRPPVRRSGAAAPTPDLLGLVAALAPTRPASVLVLGDFPVALEVLTAWPDATVRLLVPAGDVATLAPLCCDDPRLDVGSAAIGADGAPELPGSADVVIVIAGLAPLSIAGRRGLAVKIAHSVMAGGCVVSCEPVDRRGGGGPRWHNLTPQTMADRPAPTLTPTEQDVLLRAAGFAACSAWEPAPGYRAVLGVHPDAGHEPALRLRSP